MLSIDVTHTLTHEIRDGVDATGAPRRDAIPIVDDHLRLGDLWPHAPTLVGFLGGWDRRHVRTAIEHLLAEAPPVESDGRAPLLVCEACGDSFCGTVSAFVLPDDDHVLWADVRLTSGDPLQVQNRERMGGPSFRFQRAQLREALEAAVQAVYDTPLDALPREVLDADGIPLWGGTWSWGKEVPKPEWPRMSRSDLARAARSAPRRFPRNV